MKSSRERGVLGNEIVHGVAIRQHSDDLVDGNAGALYARLTVANPRVNRNSLQ